MLGRLFLAALFIALSGYMLCGPETSRASDPPPVRVEQPRQDIFACGLTCNLQDFSTLDDKARNTAIVAFRYMVSPGCQDGNMRQTLTKAIDDIFANFHVLLIQGETGTDLTIRANCGITFSAVCDGATACLGRGYPSVNDIDASTIMANYFEVSQASIWIHELMHAMAVWNEQYATCGAGCHFAPSPNWRDVMNTGTEARHYIEAIEHERWQRTMWPDAFRRCWVEVNPAEGIPCVGLDVAGSGVYWCGHSYKANIVSIAYDDGVQGDGYWVASVTGSQLKPTTACDGRPVVLIPGRCVYVIQNNAISWPDRPWFQLAGCT